MKRLGTRPLRVEITEGSSKVEVAVAASSFFNRTYGELVVIDNNKVRMCLRMKSCRRMGDKMCGRGELKEMKSDRIRRFI